MIGTVKKGKKINNFKGAKESRSADRYQWGSGLICSQPDPMLPRFNEGRVTSSEIPVAFDWHPQVGRLENFAKFFVYNYYK